MQREKQVSDYPCVNSIEAGAIFGWCGRTFRKRFNEVLHEEIRSQEKSNYRVYLLTDVIRAAFPEANDHTVHMMAAYFIYSKMQGRRNGGEK